VPDPQRPDDTLVREVPEATLSLLRDTAVFEAPTELIAKLRPGPSSARPLDGDASGEAEAITDEWIIEETRARSVPPPLPSSRRPRPALRAPAVADDRPVPYPLPSAFTDPQWRRWAPFWCIAALFVIAMIGVVTATTR
jgi:hypothetical protein